MLQQAFKLNVTAGLDMVRQQIYINYVLNNLIFISLTHSYVPN